MFLALLLMSVSATEELVATPIGDEATWVTTDDYPKSASTEGRYGTTSTRLTVDSVGSVVNCEIVESSGSADLDQAACAALSARARFDPARDGQGRPQQSTYTKRVRWVLPDVAAAVEVAPGFNSINGYVLRLHIGENGLVAACQVISANAASSSVSLPQEAQVCASARERWRNDPASDVPAGGIWVEERWMRFTYRVNPNWPASGVVGHGEIVDEQADAPPTPRPALPAAPLPPGVT